MEVKAYDPWLKAENWPEGGAARAESLTAALALADAVSVCAPKGDQPILGEVEIAAMRRGALLVNTARGGIVDEKALAAALLSGHIGAAGLDVFEKEPPDAANPLFALERVILSPHIAGLTVQAAERMAVASVENALAFLAGKADPDLIVNKPSLASKA